MKNRVITKKNKNTLKFYLQTSNEIVWLFDKDSCKTLFDYFCKGISEKEILNFKSYKKNANVTKTILQIQRQIKYAKKYILEESAVWF